MTFQDDVTLLINSCEAFSDLWEGHIKCVSEHWKLAPKKRVIVSDSEEHTLVNGVEVLGYGKKLEWSERLRQSLLHCDTPFVFLTLDDYFLVEDVNDERMEQLFQLIVDRKIDYMRFYKKPYWATLKNVHYAEGVYGIDPSLRYSLNLYSGIWKTDFLLSLIDKPKNIWQFEVGLAKKVEHVTCTCAVDTNDDFPILDVVRKGKLVRKAHRFLEKHKELYSGKREVNSWQYEIKLGFKTFIMDHTPIHMHTFLKAIGRKMGYTFVSDQID